MFDLFGKYTLPSADPPMPMEVRHEGKIILRTDNCGERFEVLGDKNLIASIYLEEGLREVDRILLHGELRGKLNRHRIGAINFIFSGDTGKIVDVEHYFTEEIFGKECPNLVEKRQDVFDIINIMKRMLNMKVFL